MENIIKRCIDATDGSIVKLAAELGIKHQSFYAWKKIPAERFSNAMAMRAELERYLETHQAGEAELKALMERLFPDQAERDRQRLGQYHAVVDA